MRINRLSSGLLLALALLYCGSRAWAQDPPTVKDELKWAVKDGKVVSPSALAWGGGSKNWYITADVI